MNKRELSKVFSKLSREEVNLESHKVELARKAPSVLKDFEKLDAKLRKSQDKVDSSFNSYRKSCKIFSPK